MAAATLEDLHSILTDNDVQNRCRAAMTRTAVNIKNEGSEAPNHGARLALAKSWLSDVNGGADDVQKYVVAAYAIANASASKDDILAMSDAVLQSHVDASVDVFIAG